MKYIGFSLSQCVKDIQAGEVREEDVELIVANTRALSPEGWGTVLTEYSKRMLWSKDPLECLLIAQRLIEAGKVIQPRVDNSHYPGVNGRWAVLAD